MTLFTVGFSSLSYRCFRDLLTPVVTCEILWLLSKGRFFRWIVTLRLTVIDKIKVQNTLQPWAVKAAEVAVVVVAAEMLSFQ